MPEIVFLGPTAARSQTDAVLRVLNEDVRHRGVAPGEWGLWESVACPFPHLRFAEPTLALRDAVRARIGREGKRFPELGAPCEPQYIWQWPTPDDYHDPPYHLDEPPPWADGKGYALIAGIALTDWIPSNGALCYERPGYDRPEPSWLSAGDALVMTPDLRHCSGLNRTGHVRAGVYFRWLVP